MHAILDREAQFKRQASLSDDNKVSAATPSRQAAEAYLPQQLPHACPCGGGCQRCQQQYGQAEAAPISSSQEHEGRADKAADMAVQGAEAHAPVSPPAAHSNQLPAGLQQHFESRLGHDLSGVRVRDDRTAAADAHALGAAAYTNGSEITFGQGAYAPHTAAGRHLLAHELSHVIQQGAAPPVAAGHAPPVSFTGRAPRTQLQAVKAVGGNWWERPDAVKKVINEKDNTPGKEISKAIEKNDLKGTQSLLRTEVIDGKTHEWRLTVRAEFLDRSAVNVGEKYGETKDTVNYKLKRDKDEIEVHEIAIEVNKYLDAKYEDEQLFPPGTKANDEARVNFMAARTLYHEMLHALIRVNDESASAPKTQATQGFEKMSSKLKTSGRLSATEQSVRQSISRVATAAEIIANRGDLFAASGVTTKTRSEKIMEEAAADKLDKKYMDKLKEAAQSIPFANKSDEHVDFIDKTMDMLLEEKYARKTTGVAFGLKDYQENSKIADDYVTQIENTLLRLARKKTDRPNLVFTGNKDYDREYSTLHTNVHTMYNLLDTEPDVTPGVGPKMFESPEMWPKPVGLEGLPVKAK